MQSERGGNFDRLHWIGRRQALTLSRLTERGRLSGKTSFAITFTFTASRAKQQNLISMAYYTLCEIQLPYTREIELDPSDILP